MTQGNHVGVIYLGVTDASTIYRSVPGDKISHTTHLFLTLHVWDWIGRSACVGQGVCMCVCGQRHNPSEQLRSTL